MEGNIPEWLSGAIVRNGGGAFSAEMKHSFDGFATLVKFRFKNGKVFMKRRYALILQVSSLIRFPVLKERPTASCVMKVISVRQQTPQNDSGLLCMCYSSSSQVFP